MSKKTKKLIIDIVITVIILGASFGVSMLFQKFEVSEQITTLFAFSVFLISLTTDGYLCGVFSAILSVFIINYSFTYPYFNRLPKLTELENSVDYMKKDLISSHFSRLAEGNCNMEVSPYYSSVVVGLERVADHLINVGYSIINPVGSQKDS